MDYITLIVIYAVGTLFGMFVGSRWGVKRGIVLGVSSTVAEFEEMGVLTDNWQETVKIHATNTISPEALEKLKKDLERLDEDEQ